MNYFQNLEDTLIQSNRKALEYGDALAWDNRKAKTSRRCLPRGKVFWKLYRKENSQRWLNFMKRYGLRD